MKLLIYFLILGNSMVSYGVPNSSDPNIVLKEMINELQLLKDTYDIKYENIERNMHRIDNALLLESSTEQKVNLLILKDQLQTELKNLEVKNISDISKIRYIKGLQIIKILYEKVLGLDHHFASVRTFSEISKIANPNQYPEYSKVVEIIKAKRDKKNSVDLTAILGSNTIVSVVNTFSNLLISNLSKEEKDIELKKIECILDFTLRMQNDLNTIYFETAYLQSSNETIRTDIETLFKDYTKPINYLTSLKECRNQDDWDSVQSKLTTFVEGIEKSENSKKSKMQIELSFPIDRLILFITQYNNFINDGEKFYQKFSTILNSYENEKQCDSKLPIEFKKLKSDIDLAIEKFNVAYKPVEINGSKMKEILYGINEFQ